MEEENREDGINIQIITSSDGTSSQSHEQTPVEATPAAASLHNIDRLKERTDHLNKIRLKLSLLRYARNDEWLRAQRIYNEFPDLVRDPLNARRDTALHIAVSENRSSFVEKLVNLMTPEDLEIPNADGNTAFCMAAITGSYHFWQIMIRKNKNLPLIPGHGGMLPVHFAVPSGSHKIVEDLSSQNLLERMALKDIERLFFMTISGGMYDVATKLLEKYRAELAIARDDQDLTALHMLARKNSEEFDQWTVPIDIDEYHWLLSLEHDNGESDDKASSGWGHPLPLLKKLWFQVRQLEYNQIVELITKPSVALVDAVKSGNVRVVDCLLEENRELMMIKDPSNGRSLLHYAVLYRQEDIFYSLIITKTVNLIMRDVDNDGNNVLHFAAKLSEGTSSSSSPNFKMHEAVTWLKKMEEESKDDELKTMRNKDGKTPTDLFYDEHKNLFDEVKEDSKGSANSGMVVATLIATISFAAALTVPGEKTNAWFIVFILTNAVALFTSSASIILFLSVSISSRFTERELFISQHPRLIYGLMLLFISIATMIIAFAAASFLIFDHISKWVAYVVALMGLFPIVMFSVLQWSIFEGLRNSFIWSIYSRQFK